MGGRASDIPCPAELEIQMLETSQKLATIDAIERERKVCERALEEVEVELQELETKRRGLFVELDRLKKQGLRRLLFNFFSVRRRHLAPASGSREAIGHKKNLSP